MLEEIKKKLSLIFLRFYYEKNSHIFLITIVKFYTPSMFHSDVMKEKVVNIHKSVVTSRYFLKL